jgi:hypothetical protein
MKIIITILVLIIAAAAVWFVYTTRAHAVEHYVCRANAAQIALTVDYPKRIATVTGGAHAGTYAGVAVTPDEVSWQGQGDFTLNRHSGRFTVMKNENNVVSLSTAECEPASLSDRLVTTVD